MSVLLDYLLNLRLVLSAYDHRVGRRLRMCYWRKPRTQVRRLIKLGVSERLAVAYVVSPEKGL